MLAQLIQRQVPIGSKVAFSLGSGHKVSGILVELGRDHVTLEHDGGTVVIPIEKIEFWEISEKQPTPEEPTKAHASENLSDSPSDGSPVPLPPSAPSSLSPLELEVTKELLEIEARFQAQLDAATIEEVKAPDFAFPANELKGDQGAKACSAPRLSSGRQLSPMAEGVVSFKLPGWLVAQGGVQIMLVVVVDPRRECTS